MFWIKPFSLILSIILSANSAYGYCPNEAQIGSGEFECPKNAIEFRILRDVVAASVRDGEISFGFNSRWQSCLQNQEFRNRFNANPKVQSCFANIFQDAPKNSQFSSLTSLPDPMADAPDLAWPEELSGPEFSKALSGSKDSGFEAVATYIKQAVNSKKTARQKWLAIPFQPTDLPVGSALLIDVPGDPEKLIHITSTVDTLSGSGPQISMLSVRKKADGSRELVGAPQYSLTELNNPSPFYNYKNKRKTNTSDCQNCHRMGLKPFLPKQIDPKYLSQYEAFINHVTELAPLKFPDDLGQHAPSLAEEDSYTQVRRSDSLFRKCAPDLSKEAIQRVKNAMNCAECHSNPSRAGMGTLLSNERFSETYRSYVSMTAEKAKAILNSKTGPQTGDDIFSYIMSGKMPKSGPHLQNIGERSALLRCLFTEYLDPVGDTPGILQAWLQQGDCGVTNEQEALGAVEKLPAVTSDPTYGALRVDPAAGATFPKHQSFGGF